MAHYEDVRASEGAERVAVLLDERVPDAPRLRAALRLVTGHHRHTVPDLVHQTGLSRRLLLDLLRRMGSDLAWDGETVRFTGTPAEYAPLTAAGQAGDAGTGDEPSDAAIDQMSRILKRVPPALRSLDHVPATAETVLRRALYLAREFDLGRARLLFAGDHDCTSLAFGVLGLAPRSVTVVDIDERLLAFIGAEAAAAGVPVLPLFADLRIGLPAAARAAHDVVFTDPPYTADGVGLFAARGIEGLAEPANGRILVAYGHSESTPALGLNVQRRLGELDLLFEAILPGFNRYQGAEAIGSSADLYRLRPTRRTAAIAQRKAGRYARTLYTQGSQAEESGRTAASHASGTPARDPGEVARAVLDRFSGQAPDDGRQGRDGGAGGDSDRDARGGRGGDRGAGPLLVGAGWPSRGAVPVERFLGGGSLPGRGAGATFVDLRPLFGWSLIRAGLAAGSDRVIVIVPMDAYGLRSQAEQGLLRDVLAPKYAVDRLLRPFDGTDAAVVVLRRPEPATPADRGAPAVAAYMWERPHGRVGNTWREGLIAAARHHGATLTKNEARAMIGRADIPAGLTGHRLIDLPAAALLRLRTAIAETEAFVPDSQDGNTRPTCIT